MQWIDDFLSLIYPNNCLSCGRNLLRKERYLCFICLNDLPITTYTNGKENPAFRSFQGRILIEEAFAYLNFEKGNKAQIILHHLKYKNKAEIGIYFGELMAEEMKKHGGFAKVDAIIPIPIHKSKEKMRSYNQSDFIAQGLKNVLKKPCLNKAVVRQIKSESQTHKKRYERWENVRDVFKINESKPEKVEHILLVDDVLTTGATLEACGQCIQKAWNVKLSMATLARTG